MPQAEPASSNCASANAPGHIGSGRCVQVVSSNIGVIKGSRSRGNMYQIAPPPAPPLALWLKRSCKG
eukprot:178031-Pelagomonas_calceolata.AAC.1